MLVLVISMDSILKDQQNSPDYARNCKDLLLQLIQKGQARGTVPSLANNTGTDYKINRFFILPAELKVDASVNYRMLALIGAIIKSRRITRIFPTIHI